MKTIVKNEVGIVFQGDLMLVRVAELPEGLKSQDTDIIGHSETGHNHLAVGAKVFAMPDGMTLYAQAIGESIDIVHKRSYDTHEQIKLLTKPGDVFKVRRQREHSPSGWVRVED
jgi:hypothetical protein